MRRSTVSWKGPENKFPFSKWYSSTPSLNPINSSSVAFSTLNSYLIPRVFESLLPNNSILPYKKSLKYKPNPLIPSQYKCEGNTEQYQASYIGRKVLNELEPIFEEPNEALYRAAKVLEGINAQHSEKLDENSYQEITLNQQNSIPVSKEILKTNSSEHVNINDSVPNEQKQNFTNQKVEESTITYNAAEAELLRTGEMIDLALNASEALELLDMGYHQKGMDILKSIAKCNHAESNFNLGVIFERGLYGNQVSIRKAIYFYNKAAKLDYPASFYNLGLIYERSTATMERQQANQLFERAAELGLVEAKQKLGHSLSHKEDVESNHQCRICKDIGWVDAEYDKIPIPSSCPETCYTLARAYHFGTSGMPQDKKYALELYREAAIKGHKKSKRAFKELKTTLAIDPLKKETTKQSRGRKLVNKIKNRAEQKMPSKFMKEYFLRSNIKNKISQSSTRSKTPRSDVEFDSNASMSGLTENSPKTDCHSMTAF